MGRTGGFASNGRNDPYGHQAADDSLQRVSLVVDGFAQRPLDLAARYDGEELAVILFDVNLDHAEKIAEQLRTAVQDLGIEHLDNSTVGVVTVTIGGRYSTAEARSRPGRCCATHR